MDLLQIITKLINAPVLYAIAGIGVIIGSVYTICDELIEFHRMKRKGIPCRSIKQVGLYTVAFIGAAAMGVLSMIRYLNLGGFV